MSNISKKYISLNDLDFSIFLKQNALYYVSLHIKLSSFLFSTQLLDIFAYQLNSNKSSKSAIFYYFFNVFTNKKLYLITFFNDNNQSIKSISELFNNANWLEREAGELSNIFFLFKKDTRNLMLPYGESSSPFNKNFPSLGYYELYYNQINDNIITSSVSIQY